MRRARLVLLALVGCGGNSGDGTSDAAVVDGPTTDAQTRPYVRGVALSPRGFPVDYQQVPAFFEEVRQMGRGAVMFNGAWRDDPAGQNAGTIPTAAKLVASAAVTYQFTPVIVFGWRSGRNLLLGVPANATNDWTNAEARQTFREMLVRFATDHHPPYLFLGNENNFYYEQDASGYAAWLIFYEEAYFAIKQASPGTLVGPVFNFEHLAGVGILNGWNQPHWPALDGHALDKVDVVGLSVYPFFSHATPEQVPAGYLKPIFDRIGSKPVVITETGWPAEGVAGLTIPWTTTPEAQVAFVPSLFSTIEGRSVPVVNWLFLYQPASSAGDSLERKLFDSVSLRHTSGDKRPVYDAWIAR